MLVVVVVVAAAVVVYLLLSSHPSSPVPFSTDGESFSREPTAIIPCRGIKFIIVVVPFAFLGRSSHTRDHLIYTVTQGHGIEHTSYLGVIRSTHGWMIMGSG